MSGFVSQVVYWLREIAEYDDIVIGFPIAVRMLGDGKFDALVNRRLYELIREEMEEYGVGSVLASIGMSLLRSVSFSSRFTARFSSTIYADLPAILFKSLFHFDDDNNASPVFDSISVNFSEESIDSESFEVAISNLMTLADIDLPINYYVGGKVPLHDILRRRQNYVPRDGDLIITRDGVIHQDDQGIDFKQPLIVVRTVGGRSFASLVIPLRMTFENSIYREFVDAVIKNAKTIFSEIVERVTH